MQIINKSYDPACPVDRLRKHARNPRRGDVAAIADSITHNGFFGAILAREGTGEILAGNHRFDAAVAMGAGSVPVVWVDVDDATARRILLADNRTNDIATYDDELLGELLAELDSPIGTGYGDDEVRKLLADEPAVRTGPEVLLDQAVQMVPTREYVVVMCETPEEFEELRARLGLKMVRRGGYKKGSQFDAVGVERVVTARRLMERLDVGSDSVKG